MASHRAHFLYREDVLNGHWKLNQFRNPKVKKVLVKCGVCHPKKETSFKKDGRIYDLEVAELREEMYESARFL